MSRVWKHFLCAVLFLTGVSVFAQTTATLSVTKTHSPQVFIPGGTGSFSITISSNTDSFYEADFTVTDTLDPAFTLGTPSGTGWECSTDGQEVICYGEVVGGSFGPNLGSITIPVTVAANASGPISNTVNAVGEYIQDEGQPQVVNAQYTDTVTVQTPQISVTETHTPAAFIAGSTGSLSIQAGNSGIGDITGTFTVMEALDPTLTVNGTAAGTGWACQTVGHAVTCTTAANTLVPAGTALPAIVVPVSVAPTASGTISNTANAEVQFALQTGTQTVAAIPYVDHLVVDAPVLKLTTTPPASVQAGGTGTIGISVANIGTALTSGPLSLTYTLAAALTPGTPVVTGTWSCQTRGQVVTCSGSDVLAVNATTSITIPFSVSTNGSGTATNTGMVSGGGAVVAATATDAISISSLSITLTAPSTASSSQPVSGTISTQLSTALDTKLTFSFASNTGDQSPVCDPTIAVILANSTSTLSSSANCSATLDLPLSAGTQTQNFQVQTGTTAGTITLSLFAPSGSATPYQTQQIVIAAAKPTINAVTVTRTGETLQVQIDPGFSNTRQVTDAIFHFVASAGNTLQNADFTLNVANLFGSYFTGTSGSGAGGSFIYTQPFYLTSDASTIASVTVTLVNNQGSSDPVTGQ